MVPLTTVPFLSSIDTVSLFNFIKNLHIFNFHFYFCTSRKFASLLTEEEEELEEERERKTNLTSFIVDRETTARA